MNKIAAELIVAGAQNSLTARFGNRSILCTGLYENYPMEIAEVIVSSQPVRVSLNGIYKEVVFTERGIQLAKPKHVCLCGKEVTNGVNGFVDHMEHSNYTHVECYECAAFNEEAELNNLDPY